MVAECLCFSAVRRLTRLEAELRQAQEETSAISQQYQQGLNTAAASEKEHQEARQQLAQRLEELENKLKTEGAANQSVRSSDAPEVNFPIYALVSVGGQAPAPVEITLSASSSRFALSIPVEDSESLQQLSSDNCGPPGEDSLAAGRIQTRRLPRTVIEFELEVSHAWELRTESGGANSAEPMEHCWQLPIPYRKATLTTTNSHPKENHCYCSMKQHFYNKRSLKIAAWVTSGRPSARSGCSLYQRMITLIWTLIFSKSRA